MSLRGRSRGHGQYRVRMDFALETVVREYALLRSAMLSHLDPLPLEIARVLHTFIDQAIMESVVAFSEGESAREEAERERRSDFERHLLGIVSHDLRTPLQAITTSAALLLRAPDLDDRQLRLLSGITTSVSRANRLIQDLLDFTSMRIGQGLELIRQDVDLQEIAQQAITELQLNHPEREIRLECEGHIQGHWDGDRIMQVFVNLLTNGLKYSTGHSTIRVRIKAQDGEVAVAVAVAVAVHNMGPPIAKERQEQLFKPMERGAEEIGRTRGVGLGLYIVKTTVLSAQHRP